MITIPYPQELFSPNITWYEFDWYWLRHIMKSRGLEMEF